MHQAAVEQDHRASRAFGCYQTATLDQLTDSIVVNRPQRVAGGRDVVLGIEHAERMATWDKHQWAVELVDLVEKDRHIHGARLGHEVVILPGAIVLVPLPEVTLEGHLAIDLELVHVHRLTKDLHDRLDHTRMAGKSGKRLAIHVCGE